METWRLVALTLVAVACACAVETAGADEFFAIKTLKTISGSAGHNQFGRAVFNAGDVNGDGYGDMVVRQFSSAEASAKYVGPVLLFLGPLSEVGGADAYDFSFQPVVGVNGSYHASFGDEVLVADVNNDGVDDVLLSSVVIETGSVYVFFGPFVKGPGGAPPRHNLTLDEASVVIKGSTFSSGSMFGNSMVACDFDASPGVDLVIGDSNYNVTGTNSKEGAVFMFSGPLVNPTYSIGDANVVLVGTEYGSSFSSDLRCSDVNGVPGPELLVSEPGYNSSAGRVLVFEQLAAGGVISAQFVGPLISTVVRSPLFNLTVMIPNGFANAFDVVDFNGDAAPDIVISCFQYPTFDDADPENAMHGEVYVFWGPFSASSPQVYTRENADVIIRGVERNEQLASSVLGVESVNDDGIADLVLSTPYYKSLRGKILVFHGLNVSSDHAQIELTSDDASAVAFGASSSAGFGYTMAYVGNVSATAGSAFVVASPYADLSDGAVIIVEEVPTTCPLYTSCKSCANGGCSWCKGASTCIFRSETSYVGCPGEDVTLIASQCPGFKIRDVLIALGIATGVCFGFGLLASRMKRFCSDDEFTREKRLRKVAKDEADEVEREKLAASLQVTVEDVMFARGASFGPAVDYGSINSTGGDDDEPVHVLSAERVQAMLDAPDRHGTEVGPVVRQQSTVSIASTSTSASALTGDDMAEKMTTFTRRRTSNPNGLSVVVPGDSTSSYYVTGSGGPSTTTPTSTTSSATTTPKLTTPRRHKMYTSDSSEAPSPRSSFNSLNALPHGAPPIPPSPKAAPPPSSATPSVPPRTTAGPPPLLPTGMPVKPPLLPTGTGKPPKEQPEQF